MLKNLIQSNSVYGKSIPSEKNEKDICIVTNEK